MRSMLVGEGRKQIKRRFGGELGRQILGEHLEGPGRWTPGNFLVFFSREGNTNLFVLFFSFYLL